MFALITALLLLLIIVLLLSLIRDTRRNRWKFNQDSREIRNSLKEQKELSWQHYWQTEKYIQLINLLNVKKPIPNLRRWASSPDILLTLSQIAITTKPASILDLGSGMSTVVLALSAPNSRIISIDHSAEYAQKTKDLLQEHGISNVEVRIAPLKAHESGIDWYDLAAFKDISNIELLFIDGPPSSKVENARHPALSEILPKLSPRAIIALDDTNRTGERNLAELFSGALPTHTLEFLPYEKGAALLTPK